MLIFIFNILLEFRRWPVGLLKDKTPQKQWHPECLKIISCNHHHHYHCKGIMTILTKNRCSSFHFQQFKRPKFAAKLERRFWNGEGLFSLASVFVIVELTNENCCNDFWSELSWYNDNDRDDGGETLHIDKSHIIWYRWKRKNSPWSGQQKKTITVFLSTYVTFLNKQISFFGQGEKLN